MTALPRNCMQLIRQCEEQLARSHQRGLIHGACHTYVGQEAIAVGVCAHLGADDVVFSTHRGHGHALAKGMPPEQLMAELFGRATGCSRGRGGSMHLFAPEIGLMGTSGIVGPCILQAAGAGYTFKLLKTDQVAVAFFGDGAVNNGAPSTRGSTWLPSGSCQCCSSARTTISPPRCPLPTRPATLVSRPGAGCMGCPVWKSMATMSKRFSAWLARRCSGLDRAWARRSWSAGPTAPGRTPKEWAISPIAPEKKSRNGRSAVPSSNSGSG